MEQGQRMGWGWNLLGRGLNALIPVPAFNPNAPSFGQGWTSSPFAQAWRDARTGDYRALGGQAAPLVGGAVAGPLGMLVGTAYGRHTMNNPSIPVPQFSQYGPYASGYLGLPANGVPSTVPSALPDWSTILDYGQEGSPSALAQQQSSGGGSGNRGGGSGGNYIPRGTTYADGWGAAGNFQGVASSPYLMQFGGWGGNPTGLGGGLASLTEDPSGLGLSHTVTRAL